MCGCLVVVLVFIFYLLTLICLWFSYTCVCVCVYEWINCVVCLCACMYAQCVSMTLACGLVSLSLFLYLLSAVLICVDLIAAYPRGHNVDLGHFTNEHLVVYLILVKRCWKTLLITIRHYIDFFNTFLGMIVAAWYQLFLSLCWLGFWLLFIISYHIIMIIIVLVFIHVIIVIVNNFFHSCVVDFIGWTVVWFIVLLCIMIV